jgi:N-succinyldiaminopimelate aminotransferase
MNSELSQLQPYPFEKLTALKAAVTANADYQHIALSVGEPKHPAPKFVVEELVNNISYLSNYPTTKGLPELRQAISAWAIQRFGLKNLDSNNQVLPVNGTREAIFAFVQACFDRKKTDKPLIISPNPFYQIYEGAAFLSGAHPHFLPCTKESGFNPDFTQVSDETWAQTQIVFLCSPNNPTGAVVDIETLQFLIKKADEFDFVVASDECYSELYFDESNPPAGLLQACAEMGRDDYARCIVFHSLSKRSNLPGLRSGFIAGDHNIINPMFQYRTYHGCAMPLHHQVASIAAWGEESHVLGNRDLYRIKFQKALTILDEHLEVRMPEASFYLWAKVPSGDDETFAQQLFEQKNVTVLPGSYLSREVEGVNPGAGYIRMALVATIDECIEAAERIADFVISNK